MKQFKCPNCKQPVPVNPPTFDHTDGTEWDETEQRQCEPGEKFQTGWQTLTCQHCRTVYGREPGHSPDWELAQFNNLPPETTFRRSGEIWWTT